AHANEEVVRSYVTAFAAGDLDTARTYLDDDVVYHVGGRHSLAGDYRGPDEAVAFFRERAARTGGTFKVIPHDLLANAVHAVALSAVTAERDGVHYAWDVVTVYHVAGGKVTECWIIDGDQELAAQVLA
ncbi:MAG TPA: nuclear transport factor 2 family protein, partial [Acidimicrobiales bacterium]|nr:nuclear transport factor 2 family protein [Acidimicrobiales bacterium]